MVLAVLIGTFWRQKGTILGRPSFLTRPFFFRPFFEDHFGKHLHQFYYICVYILGLLVSFSRQLVPGML